jgi:hypothetical protein
MDAQQRLTGVLQPSGWFPLCPVNKLDGIGNDGFFMGHLELI